MDSLYNLLAGKNFDEPPEIAIIKQFARDQYKTDVQVTMRERDIVIAVPGASLAGKLRFDLPRLKEKLETDKRLVIRISR